MSVRRYRHVSVGLAVVAGLILGQLPPGLPAADAGTDHDPAPPAAADRWGPSWRSSPNPDGTRTLEAFTTPRFVEGADGAWRELDTSLRSTSDGERYVGRVVPATAAHIATALRSDTATVNLSTPAGPVAVHHIETTGDVTGATTPGDGAAVFTDGLTRGRDVAVEATYDGFKDSVIVPDTAAGASYRLTLDLPRGVTVHDDDGGIVLAGSDGSVVARYGDGVAIDAASERGPVTVSVLTQRPGRATVEVAADPGWWNTPGRVFPVTIDPTWQTINDQHPACADPPSPTSMCDTWVREERPDETRWNDDRVFVGPAGSHNYRRRAFVKFATDEFGTVAGGVDHRYHVVSATMTLQATRVDTAPAPVVLYGAASSPSTATTWNNQPARDAAGPVSTLGVVVGANSFDVTSLVQRWFDGQPNHGMRIEALDETDPANRVDFRAGTGDLNKNPPSLTVTYIDWPSAPADVTAAGAGGAIQVDWDPADDGGGTLTYDVVLTRDDNGSTHASASCSACTQHLFTGLPAGVAFKAWVRATNETGAGPWARAWGTVSASDPLTVSLDQPAYGDVVFDNVNVTAQATPGFGVDEVQFLVDDSLVATDTDAPYTTTLDSSAWAPGEHDITARAIDTLAQSFDATVVVRRATGADLLDRDHAQGTISVDDYVRYAIWLAVGDPATPAPYADGTELDMSTVWVVNALSYWADLDPTTQQELIAYFNGESGAAAAAAPGALDCGGGFWRRFHYDFDCEAVSAPFTVRYNLESSPGADDGVRWQNADDLDGNLDPVQGGNGRPDYVDKVLWSLHRAYDHYTDPAKLGYRAADSIEVLLGRDPGQGGRALPILDFGLAATPRFILLPYRDREYHLPMHELFHQIQFEYLHPTSAGAIFRLGSFLWWTEASAEWAAHQALAATVAPASDAAAYAAQRYSYANDVDAFLAEPTKAIDRVPDPRNTQGPHYGAFIVAEWLHKAVGVDAIRTAWERAGSGILSNDAFAEVHSLLHDGGSSWAEFWRATYLLDGAYSIANRIDTTEIQSWREFLSQEARTSYAAGHPISATSRMATELVVLRDGDVDSGHDVELGPAAAQVLEVKPTGTLDTVVEVVANVDGASVVAVPMATYPYTCAGVPDVVLDTVDGRTFTTTLAAGSPCDYWAVLIVNGSDNSTITVDWSARAGGQVLPGDLLVSDWQGAVHHVRPDGTPVQVLQTGFAGDYTATGSAFGPDGDFYVTNFNGQAVTRFTPDGTRLGLFGSGYADVPESIVFDGSGNAYVGHATADGASSADVHKVGPSGTLLASYDVAIEDRGSDWIDLAPDGCTLLYTSEGTRIMRYDVCTDTQLPDFASVETRPLFAVRWLADGGVLAANRTGIARFTASGTLVQTYDAPGQDGWFALDLAGDNTFWAVDDDNGVACRFSLDLLSPPFGHSPPGCIATGAAKGNGISIVPGPVSGP